MPLDLNEKDQNNQASSSSSTLLYPILFDPHHDQPPSSTLSRTNHEEAEKILISSIRSWDYAADQRDDISNSSLKPKEDRKYGIRVCADCHTTKTPLWRSGPTGPKSLCNACGIRQRKARRAAMAAASVNGAIIAPKAPVAKGNNKLHKKQKKQQIECTRQSKKKPKKLGTKACRGRKNFGFEDFTISLRNNLAHQQVFPQDEKEAAILLMSLSYGLVHV